MPRLERSHELSAARLWEGRCPVKDCQLWFQVEADPQQPRWDVHKAFNEIRPEGEHVHGSFWVVEGETLGGE